MLVYNLETGKIIAQIPDSNDPYFVLQNHKDVKSNNIGTLITERPIRKISEYKVVNGNLVKIPEEDLEEIRLYKKILNDEERLLLKLQPSPEEVEKAETTIEILSLLQEVM